MKTTASAAAAALLAAAFSAATAADDSAASPAIAAAAAATSSSVTATARRVEGVSQAAIQSAFQILRSEYIRSGDLTFDELNRAALQGLLERLGPGADLVRKLDAVKPATESGVIAEKLTDDIGYVRPLAFAESEPALLEARLKEFRQARLTHLILDLRSTAIPGDFAVAAAMLENFVPRGELLFKLTQVGREDAQLFISSREPVWTSSLIVLVDEDTNNIGETVAAVLRLRKQALLMGSATRGASVRYETLPLDDAWLLKFARAEMLLPDGSSLFKKGLQPDFPIPLPVEEKRRIFASIMPRHSVLGTIQDTMRPRYNEAALVARKNPELDEYVRRSAGRSPEVLSTPQRDTVLQRTVDMLNTRRHLQAMKLDWDKSRRGPGPATVKKARPAPAPAAVPPTAPAP